MTPAELEQLADHLQYLVQVLGALALEAQGDAALGSSLELQLTPCGAIGMRRTGGARYGQVGAVALRPAGAPPWAWAYTDQGLGLLLEQLDRLYPCPLVRVSPGGPRRPTSGT